MSAGSATLLPAAAVRAVAPCRVDLAGGTLDIWPLGLLHRGARTINFALSLDVAVELHPRSRGILVRAADSLGAVEVSSPQELLVSPDTALVGLALEHFRLTRGLEVHLRSRSPRGGGLGASSALTVALLAAVERFAGLDSSEPRQLARVARDLEARLMSLPTGCQDHYPALLGGALSIEAQPGGEAVRALDVDLESLGRCLVVAYTGQSHFSAGANWTIIRRRLEGDAEIVSLLDGIASVAIELEAALVAGDLERVGALMSEEWSFRRQLSPAVPTERLESLLRAGIGAGAWGGKACGAGGGGSIAFLAPPKLRSQVSAQLAAMGALVLDASPTPHPLVVEG